MTHFGSKRRTLSEIYADLKAELATTRRLDSLTVEELTRRYSRLKPQVVEAELENARKLAGMSAQERFAALVGGEK